MLPSPSWILVVQISGGLLVKLGADFFGLVAQIDLNF
jgi:hypothetical protein